MSCFAFLLIAYNRREREFEAPRYTVPKAPKVEAMLLKNLTDKYDVSKKVSYDTISSAYVLKLYGTAYDATILSECQLWIDTFILNTKYQTLDSTSCFIDGALETAKEIMLIQAHPSQDNDIEIIDHYTTASEMRLPKVWVASIKIHDRLPEAEILAKNVIVACLSKVTGSLYGHRIR
jgi:hypothetical protein